MIDDTHGIRTNPYYYESFGIQYAARYSIWRASIVEQKGDSRQLNFINSNTVGIFLTDKQRKKIFDSTDSKTPGDDLKSKQRISKNLYRQESTNMLHLVFEDDLYESAMDSPNPKFTNVHFELRLREHEASCEGEGSEMKIIEALTENTALCDTSKDFKDVYAGKCNPRIIDKIIDDNQKSNEKLHCKPIVLCSGGMTSVRFKNDKNHIDQFKICAKLHGFNKETQEIETITNFFELTEFEQHNFRTCLYT